MTVPDFHAVDFHVVFSQLEQQLWQHRRFWQCQPMQQAELAEPYADLPAALAQALQSLDLTQCAALDADDDALHQQLGHHFADVVIPEIPRHPAKAVAAPFWLATGIGGRKWQQICQFAGAVGQRSRPVMEWCAGKGHLGRVLAAQFGVAVQSIEWQASLCEHGLQLAQQWQLPQSFLHLDVLNQATAPYFQPAQQWVALHACGDLHRVGLAQALAAGTSALALVPCCYHLQSADSYQYRSLRGQQSQLMLSKADLRMAVQGHATGGARIARLSQQEMTWRHAFRVYAQSQGRTSYQPLSSVAKQLFSHDAMAFFSFACQQHALPLPTPWQLQEALQQAEQRLLVQRRLELCQHLFRRPLEIYLVLDLVLWLQEHHYQVALHQLCESQLTPRNLLITANL